VKTVLRGREGVAVWYNGERDGDEERADAAAAVADGYRMFLLGPFFFLERGATVELDEPDTVEGRECDQLLAVLAPGIGRSKEDRVLVAIDRRDRLVRRLRFTFRGLESTRNVVADVLTRRHRRVGGVLWPTDFEEIVRRPIDLRVHVWKATGLDVDRGLVGEEVAGPKWSEAAAAPAAPLEAAEE
jgi:hypothetical protein